MKKTFVISMAILSAMACSKDNATTQTVKEHRLVPMTFTAEVDDFGKATIEGLKTYWEAGDEISVSKTDATKRITDAPVLTAQTAGATTTFTGNAPEGLSKYIAVYPASSVTCWNDGAKSSTKDCAYVNLKKVQEAQLISTVDGVDNYMDPAVMYLCGTAGTDLKFTFKHPFAYIKFTIPQNMTKKIKTITVTANKTITGSTITLNWKSTYWELGIQGTTKTAVIKNADESPLKPGNYYLAVYPRKGDSSKNYASLSFDFYHYSEAAGNVHIIKEIKDSTNGISLVGGTVYKVPEIPVNLFD